MAFTNQHCIGVFEDITDPTREGNFRIYAGDKGRAGHADGQETEAQFNSPRQLVLDEEENLYIADSGNHCIRKVTPEGVVSTVIGTLHRTVGTCHRQRRYYLHRRQGQPLCPQTLY